MNLVDFVLEFAMFFCLFQALLFVCEGDRRATFIWSVLGFMISSSILWPVLAQVYAAYFVLDALIGIYHWATDQGWNIPQQVKLFQTHHVTNQMDGYDWQPLVGAIPGFILGLYLNWHFLIALSVLTVFAQVPHYFAHNPPKRGPVKWLQDAGVIVSPRHHAAHHRGKFDQNFCVFSGLNDWWLNPLLRRLSRS